MGWCSNLEGRDERKDFRHGNSQRSSGCYSLAFTAGGLGSILVGEPGSSKSQGVIMESLFPGITFTLPVRFAIPCIHGMRKLHGRS